MLIEDRARDDYFIIKIDPSTSFNRQLEQNRLDLINDIQTIRCHSRPSVQTRTIFFLYFTFFFFCLYNIDGGRRRPTLIKIKHNLTVQNTISRNGDDDYVFLYIYIYMYVFFFVRYAIENVGYDFFFFVSTKIYLDIGFFVVKLCYRVVTSLAVNFLILIHFDQVVFFSFAKRKCLFTFFLV